MQHIIEWPGGEWLNKTKALKAIGIPETMFDRLLFAGLISAPRGGNDRVKLWHWSEVYALAQLWPNMVEFLDKMQPPEELDKPQSRKK